MYMRTVSRSFGGKKVKMLPPIVLFCNCWFECLYNWNTITKLWDNVKPERKKWVVARTAMYALLLLPALFADILLDIVWIVTAPFCFVNSIVR